MIAFLAKISIVFAASTLLFYLIAVVNRKLAKPAYRKKVEECPAVAALLGKSWAIGAAPGEKLSVEPEVTTPMEQEKSLNAVEVGTIALNDVCGLLNILSFQSRIKCGRYGVISVEERTSVEKWHGKNKKNHTTWIVGSDSSKKDSGSWCGNETGFRCSHGVPH